MRGVELVDGAKVVFKVVEVVVVNEPPRNLIREEKCNYEVKIEIKNYFEIKENLKISYRKLKSQNLSLYNFPMFHLCNKNLKKKKLLNLTITNLKFTKIFIIRVNFSKISKSISDYATEKESKWLALNLNRKRNCQHMS